MAIPAPYRTLPITRTRFPHLHPAWLLLTVGLVLLAAACGGSSKKPEPTPIQDQAGVTATPLPEPTAVPPPIRVAPLTGEVISEEHFLALEGQRPLAVMIDNIAAATPQAGLDQADVVIEALVEGGVTRFMAVFHSKAPAVIEPVRSARTPFLYWAAEYDALYAHVGSAELDGPADAGRQIHEWGIHDLDLGTQPFDYSYVRDPNRLAPHNVLIDASKLRQRAVELGREGPPALVSWPFTVPEGLLPGVPALRFSVQFGPFSPRFSVQWDWDASVQRYLRSQFGEPQHDAASGNRLAFANVIIQYANAYLADGNGHVLIDVVGEGPAQVYSNGQLVEGTWRKTGLRERTEFLGPDGAPIPLLAGPTWIEVVQPSGRSTVF